MATEHPVTIRTAHGTFWTAEGGGGRELVADRTQEGEWERFTLIDLGEGYLALRACDGHFVCAEEGGGGQLTATRQILGAWESLQVRPVEGGGVVLVTDAGYAIRAVDTGELLADRAADEAGAWEVHQIDGWDQTPPPPDARLRGRLRVTGGAYEDDTGPRLPVGCHLGDGLSAFARDPERVVAWALDPIAAAGYQWVRTWLTLAPMGSQPGDYWHGREVGPWVTHDYAEVLATYLRACEARGLRVHLAHGDLAGLNRAEREHAFDLVAAVVQTVGVDPVLMEGLNEARDTGCDDPVEVERLVNRWRSRLGTDRLYALSAYTGTEERDVLNVWTPSWMPMCYYHAYRGGHLWDKARHSFSMAYEDPVRRLQWSGEPTGPGPRVSATENAHELDDPEAMCTLAAASIIFRAAFTYFCSDGVILDGPIDRWAGFREIPALARRLEAFAPDLHRFPVLTHAADYKPDRVWDLPDNNTGVRLDQAVSDHAAVGRLYGPSGSVTVDALGGHETLVLDPATGAETVGGARFTATFRYGRILLARW